MVKLPIYLDNNSTTPMDPRVLDAMMPYFTQNFGNAASRNHPFGWKAEEAVDYAREQIAQLIGANEKEIIFTSGATESNNLAIKGVLEMYARKGNHIITTNTEHKAVLDACKHAEKMGAELTYLEVEENGILDLQKLQEAIKQNTVLISVMWANNEIGVIQPVQEISRMAKERGVLFHTDATQAVGKIPVNVIEDGIDLMSFTAHKMYGPKGIGALYVRRKNPRVKVSAQIDGGGHERGMRSGTLNVTGIVGFGAACKLCREEMNEESKRLAKLRDKLENALLALEESYVNGSKENRLPHCTNVSFKFVEGEGLMMAMHNLAVSSGSACTSASLEPSYVLRALGRDDELAHSSIRITIGRYTTEEEVDYAVELLKKSVAKLRDLSPLWDMYKDGVDLEKVEWVTH